MSVKNYKLSEKCRCCLNPSVNFVHLESSIKTCEGMEKTYKELLYEITNLTIPYYREYVMPQQICHKCSSQLQISYKFIQQAYEVSQQYLQIADDHQQSVTGDVRNFENLHESLIEITETISDTKCQEEIKVEQLILDEGDKDIKQEKVDNELLMVLNDSKEESDENREFLENSNTEDDDGSDEPESFKGNDNFLLNEPLARRCDICHKIFRDEKFLKIHKRYTHMPEEDKIPCPLCSYRANRSWALKVHMGVTHGQDKVEEYFKPALDSHKTHRCSLCSRSYARKESLRKHINRKHLNKSIPNKEESSKKLKPPKQKEKERFLCTHCGQSFSSKGGLESHDLTHTDERPFSCDICSKTFKRVKDLQLHRVIHSDEKPHQCSECGKAFKRLDKLKIHMRVHSELRPYKCNECEKTFKYQSVLRTHMHIHTGQTPFACRTCGEAFSLRTSLNNHCIKYGHIK